VTVEAIKNEVMFQTNNDTEDVGDYLPSLLNYINDGYDRLVRAWTKSHTPQEDYPRLEADSDEPNLPEWLHRYIADWATWLVYRNGNPSKQTRGLAFKTAFEEIVSTILGEGGANGLNEDGTSKQYKHFFNIPL
jgi:hypothetical protein